MVSNKTDPLICCLLCGDRHTLQGNNGGDPFYGPGWKTSIFTVVKACGSSNGDATASSKWYVHLKLLVQTVIKPLISNYLTKRAELSLFYIHNTITDEPLIFSSTPYFTIIHPDMELICFPSVFTFSGQFGHSKERALNTDHPHDQPFNFWSNMH
jgi:hypothetical protein